MNECIIIVFIIIITIIKFIILIINANFNIANSTLVIHIIQIIVIVCVIA